jgi:2'-5' RNA ligase
MPAFDYERDEYVPHVTLGHFQSSDGLDALFADLAPLRERALSLSVDAVELITVPPASLYPSFETVARIEL